MCLHKFPVLPLLFYGCVAPFQFVLSLPSTLSLCLSHQYGQAEHSYLTLDPISYLTFVFLPENFFLFLEYLYKINPLSVLCWIAYSESAPPLRTRYRNTGKDTESILALSVAYSWTEQNWTIARDPYWFVYQEGLLKTKPNRTEQSTLYFAVYCWSQKSVFFFPFFFVVVEIWWILFGLACKGYFLLLDVVLHCTLNIRIVCLHSVIQWQSVWRTDSSIHEGLQYLRVLQTLSFG